MQTVNRARKIEHGNHKHTKPEERNLKNAVHMKLAIQIPFDGPYGTKSEKMACPLSALIEARFTDFSQEGKDYPDVSVLDKKFVSEVKVGESWGFCCSKG